MMGYVYIKKKNITRLTFAILETAIEITGKMDRVKRIWYLSLMRAVSQEEPSDRKPDLWPLRMAGHVQLKFVMTECSKTHIRLTGLK